VCVVRTRFGRRLVKYSFKRKTRVKSAKSRVLLGTWGILSLLLTSGAFSTPAFAGGSSLHTDTICKGPSGCPVGTDIVDTATFCLDTHPTTNACTQVDPQTVAASPGCTGGAQFGHLCFDVWQGTCGTINTGGFIIPSLIKHISSTGFNETAPGTNAYTNAFESDGQAAGDYVWIVTFEPSVFSSLTVRQVCEPFKLTAASTAGVPEFPLGVALLMAFAIPAILFAKNARKSNNNA
jgi:hypothetical protein